MDMHPAGGPRLVGPAGFFDFNPLDSSTHFRFLPNSNISDFTGPHIDSLVLRHHAQPLHLLHSASPGPRSPGPHQPLRLRDEHAKAGSPRSPASPQHLLPGHSSFFSLQSPAHSAAAAQTDVETRSVTYFTMEEGRLPLEADNHSVYQAPNYT